MNTATQVRLAPLPEAATDGAGAAYCRCCQEVIQAGAQLCPHCRSSQRPPSKLQVALNTLKWIGATTAIFSIVALSIQLTGIFEDSRNRRRAVKQYVDAAEHLRANNDLAGVLEMLDEALQLEPTNPDAKALQLSTAMQQIRQYVDTLTRDAWEEKIAPLISKIRRGIGHNDPALAAAVRAHLAWAHSLLDMHHAAIVTSFQDALAADPRNLFANTLWGGWCVRAFYKGGSLAAACGEDPLRKATTHFQTVLDQEKAPELVGRLAFQTLVRRYDWRSTDAIIEALVLANALGAMGSETVIANSGLLFQELCKRLDFGDNEAALLDRLSPADLLRTLGNIAPDPEDESYLDDIVTARLRALAGERDQALGALKALRVRLRRLIRSGRSDSWPAGFSARFYVDKAIIHLLEMKTSSLGLQVETDESDEKGARIRAVTTGGSADRAGLQPGDRIVGAGDFRIQCRKDLVSFLAPLPPGETLSLDLLRNGEHKMVSVTLDPGGDPLKYASQDGDYLHRMVNRRFYQPMELYRTYNNTLQVADLDGELRAAYAIDESIQGAINLERFYDGRVIFDPGDVITAVNGYPVQSPQEVAVAFRKAGENGPRRVPIQILGAKGFQTKTLLVR